MIIKETCATCDGSGAVAVGRGFDACPRGCLDQRPSTPRLTLAPLVSAPPTTCLSAAVAACVASSYGRVRPRLVDHDEVTVVARFGGGVR
jgi:hypothetical protein